MIKFCTLSLTIFALIKQLNASTEPIQLESNSKDQEIHLPPGTNKITVNASVKVIVNKTAACQQSLTNNRVETQWQVIGQQFKRLNHLINYRNVDVCNSTYKSKQIPKFDNETNSTFEFHIEIITKNENSNVRLIVTNFTFSPLNNSMDYTIECHFKFKDTVTVRIDLHWRENSIVEEKIEEKRQISHFILTGAILLVLLISLTMFAWFIYYYHFYCFWKLAQFDKRKSIDNYTLVCYPDDNDIVQEAIQPFLAESPFEITSFREWLRMGAADEISMNELTSGTFILTINHKSVADDFFETILRKVDNLDVKNRNVFLMIQSSSKPTTWNKILEEFKTKRPTVFPLLRKYLLLPSRKKIDAENCYVCHPLRSFLGQSFLAKWLLAHLIMVDLPSSPPVVSRRNTNTTIV